MKFIDASRAWLAAFGRKPDVGLPYAPDWEGLARDWAALNHEQEVQLTAQKAAYDAAVAIAGDQAEEQANWIETLQRRCKEVETSYQALIEATQLEHGRAERDAATIIRLEKAWSDSLAGGRLMSDGYEQLVVRQREDAAIIARLEKEKWELVELMAGRERAMEALTKEHGRVLAARQLAEEVQGSQSEVISTQHQGLLDYERDTRKLQEEMAKLETRLNQDHETIVGLRGELSTAQETLALSTDEMEKGTAALARLNTKSNDLIKKYQALAALSSRALSLLLHPMGLHQPWPKRRDELAAEMKEAGIVEPQSE